MNIVVLKGNLTRDPVQRGLPSGQFVTETGIAINRKYTVNGEKREEVAFIDLSAWGGTGDLLAKYFKKGDPLLLRGRLKFDQWEKDGQKRSKLSVVVDEVGFVGGKREDAPSNITNPDAVPPSDFDPTPF